MKIIKNHFIAFEYLAWFLWIVFLFLLLSTTISHAQEKKEVKEQPKEKTIVEVAQVKLNELNKAYQDLEKQKNEFLGKYYEALTNLQQQANAYQTIINENKKEETKPEIKKESKPESK